MEITSFKSPKEQLEIILHRVAECIREEELLKKLEISYKEKKPLRVKLGIDASGPDIHLGFAVPLRKLRQFQELGHTAVLIVGDFTGMIGDPTGRSKTRPQLTEEQIRENIKRYTRQLYKILLPERTEIRYNSEWLGKLTAKDIVMIASKYTVARMIERDDFSKRLKEGIPVYIHEILYPLFQGYDSVMVDADVELGGTDQKFNFMVARELMREFGKEPEVIITMPLLEGTDGKMKMSKSYGNYIGIEESPNEMFGKIMSLPDELIMKYFYLCTELSDEEIKDIEKKLQQGENPKNIKMLLAQKIVSMYHSQDDAEKAKEEFERVFSKREVPTHIPEFKIKEEKRVIDVMVEAGMVSSRSEAKRLIAQGGVDINGEKIKTIDFKLLPGKEYLIKVGKRRFLRVL